MKILIVEDDKETAHFIARGLEPLGFMCTATPTGEDGLKLLPSLQPDLILVDIQLPGISGLELIRRIREQGSGLPILILSSLGQPGDKICGLNIGADDYMAKPFALNELIARVNALLRRSTSPTVHRQIRVKDLVIDAVQRKAIRSGRVIELTDLEFKILEYLAHNAGHVLSVKMIFHAVWRCDHLPATKVVEARICILRQKLCADGETDLIHTIRGFGYVLK